MARRRRHQDDFDPVLSRYIIALILAILAIIIILSFFGKAEAIGVLLNEYLLSFLFGSIRFATPFILFVLAWFLIKDIEYDYRSTHLIGAGLFFLAVASLFHLSFDPSDMWRQALDGHGGGVFGMLAWPLKTYLGSIASVVILIGLTIVSIILTFNTSVTEFVMMHQRLFERLGGFGTSIVRGIKTLFVPPREEGAYADEEDEEYDEDEEYEDEEEEEEEERRFSSRSLRTDEEEEEEEEEESEDEEEEEEEPAKPPTNLKHGKVISPGTEPAWAKNVVVKDIPPVTLLSSKKGKPTSGDIESNQQTIQDTFREFRIDVTMGDVRVGPTVTQYTMKPAKGVKLSRITSLSNDLALALAAHPIRIEAPIPGKSLVGIEVPNQKAAMVSFRETLESKEFKKRGHNVMLSLGKDVAGKVWFADLPRMPHLLIAGATGSGKTVCVNSIIMSLLYQNTAETLRMIMVDPKRVELTLYNGIPHLLTPVITNTSKTVNALKWAIGEMDRRFEILSQVKSRDITSYNKKNPKNKLPHIVFVIDELADLMATAANDVEAGIIRLAQMARAVGIHLIVATQRPSVDVITGLMKANIPGRIAFSVASLIDSRTILDAPGAEKLIGRGDMLFQTAELSKPVRIQGAFISEDDVHQVVEHLKGDEEPVYDESITQKPTGGTMNMFGGPSDDQDPLFNDAKNAIMDAGKASASFLQRRLKVGYARAARILDELEEAGIIGPSDGAKPREILMTREEVETMGAGQELNAFKEEAPEEEEIEEEEVEEELEEEMEEDVDEEEEYEDEEDEEEDDEDDGEIEEEYEDDDDDEEYEEEEYEDEEEDDDDEEEVEEDEEKERS